MKQGANGRIFFVDHSKYIHFDPINFVINLVYIHYFFL